MIVFKNPFLQVYSEYTEYTEPQIIFNLWCGISGLSAALGRRVYHQFGIEQLYPNTYVILVGPPAARKSTAIKWMLDRLKKATKIRFAPDDTAGQRQGLIRKFISETEKDASLSEIELENIVSIAASGRPVDLSSIEMHIHPKDKHVLYAVASELDSLIGTNSRELTTFLIKCWDGSDYDYSTSAATKIIKEPLLSILAGTQPSTLNECLPSLSVGSGFSSRLVFVFASKKRKGKYPPAEPDNYLAKEIENVYSHLFYKMEGEMKMTREAWGVSHDIYDQDITIDDPRFVYYCNRRHIHALKLSMLLAAGRISYTITADDVIEANAILTATEQFMPEALGEFGLSPAGAAKQKVIEFLQYIDKPVTLGVLWKTLRKDVKSNFDFLKAVEELVLSNSIEKITDPKKGELFMLRRKLFDIEAVINELNLNKQPDNITRLEDVRAKKVE